MKHPINSDNRQKMQIHELSKLLQEMNLLKKRTRNEMLQRDYEIYIRDIRRFLDKISAGNVLVEESQVYIDDYREVIQIAKMNIGKKHNSKILWEILKEGFGIRRKDGTN